MIYDLWVKLFARARFVRLNRFLYAVSIRGLGILNYGSLEESGERHFLQRVLAQYPAARGGPCVVLDVGANVGNYTREVLGIAPAAQVYCFEPHPGNVGRLREAIAARATVVPKAVGAQPGTLELFDYQDEDGSSHASVYKDVFEKIHKRPHVAHQVPVTTIDSFIAESGLTHIALLKIDTEGHELAALDGAVQTLRRQAIDVVHFEFNEMNIASRTFLSDFFERLPDFRLFRLLRDGWVPLGDRPLENIFAFQNVVAVRKGSPADVVFA